MWMADMTPATKRRLGYLAGTALLLITEVLIALYVRDGFVRPYLGDVLVVVLLYSIARTLFPTGMRLLPLYLLLLAAAVEIAQHLDILSLLGIGADSVLRIVFGSVFSWTDMLCYLVGAIICAGVDALVMKGKEDW